MTSVKITEYTEDEQLETLAALADEIWHECFPGIISEEQIDYMVERFQSYGAMKEQIEEEGYRYYVLEIDGVPSGYFGLCKQEGGWMLLSKLYLRAELRGKGFASMMFREIKRYTRRAGCELIKLTVNKHNTHAINVYEHKGMRRLDEVVTDIGGGFVMDDYIYGIMI